MKLTPLPIVARILLAALALPSPLSAAAYHLAVAAGDRERDQSIVTFALPESGAAWRLRDARGREVPLQTRGREGVFVVPRLAAGSTATYRLESGQPAASDAAVALQREGGRILARRRGATLLAFQEAPGTPPKPDIADYYRRGGYIHPVFSPSGIMVTDDYPPDHFHHHGIWFAWVKTEYEGRHPDF